MTRVLVVRWDAEALTWRVVDLDSRVVVESFTHVADAAWFVQTEQREGRAS